MKRITGFARSFVTTCVVILFFTFSSSDLFGQTYTEYEPSFAVWELGVQMGVIEYGAYVNATPSSLMPNFDKAIEMALASGCVPSDGLIQLKNRMQALSNSNSLYNEILAYRGQLGGIITNSCSCVAKSNSTNTTTATFYPDIAGTWYQNGDPNLVCNISQNGQYLSYQLAGSTSQGYFSSSNVIFASDWNAQATLSVDYLTITWGNQIWTRNTTPPPTTPPPTTPPPTTPPPTTPPPTTTTGGGIIDIAGEDIAANSTYIWVCLSNGIIYSIPVSTRQPQVFSNDKIATRIAADENNRPWIIDDKQLVWYHNGSTWINTNSGQCKAIAMDQYNRCWVIDYGWMIKYYDEANQQWVPVEKRDGRALGVVNENLIYHSSFYRDVSRKQSGNWQSLPGLLEDLDVSYTGKLFGTGTDDNVYEFVNGNWVKKAEYGLAKRIAVAPNGDVYTIKLK